LRRSGLGVFEFPRRQPRCQQRKNGARNLFGIDAGVAMYAILNALDESASASRPASIGWVPAIIVQSTQQSRQLRANIHGLFLRQDITKRMQGGEKSGIDPLPIMPPETLLEIVDPFLGGADGPLEFCKVPHMTSADLWNRALRNRRTFRRQGRFLNNSNRLLPNLIWAQRKMSELQTSLQPENFKQTTRVRGQAAVLTSIFFSAFCASWLFGSVTVSTPLLKAASILLVSTPSGTRKLRSNEPKRRSLR
jgi:hypothetical protein